MNLYDYLENKYLKDYKNDFENFEEFVETFFNTNFFFDSSTWHELLTPEKDIMDEIRMSYKLNKKKRSIEITVLCQ